MPLAEGQAETLVPRRWKRTRLLLRGCGFCGGVGVLLRETFDAACRIDQLLFAGEERVAIRADFDAQHVTFDGRARGKRVAAGAVYGYLMIVGVNTGFHGAPVFRVRSARLPGLGHYSRVARSRDNR